MRFSDFQRVVDNYVNERNWKRYHTPKDIAISIAIESSELLELFQWKPDPVESGNVEKALKDHIGEELADISIYCACMANVLGIDLSEVVIDKIKKNERKYPVGKVAKAKNWDEVRLVRTRRSGDGGDD